MGEAMLTRAGGAGGSSEPAIPVLPGYHSILVTLRDYQGGLVKNYGISCKDGAQTYNYTTNEKGQSLFTTNSGKANFTILNNYGGVRFLDFDTTLVNKDAPLGQTSKLEIKLNKAKTTFVTASGNYKFFLAQNNLNTTLCGGGGGGGGGDWYKTDDGDNSPENGGRGGSGYLTNFKGSFDGNMNYYISIGSGGRGGRADWQIGKSHAENGTSGGSTTMNGTGKSAAGGSGGEGGGQGRFGGTPGNPGAGGPGLSPYGIGGTGGIGQYGYQEYQTGGDGKAGCVKFTF